MRPGPPTDCPWSTKSALDRFAPRRPSLWVTRRRPKIDRIACPWLIRRFIDPDARILFVDPPEVPAVARETGAIPFDIDGVEISHEGERCSFDTMLETVRPRERTRARAPRADRTRRRYRAARSRAGSLRTARHLAWLVGARGRRRPWAAASGDLSSMMGCLRICGSPRSVITGRPRRREGMATDRSSPRHRRHAKAGLSRNSSRSGSRSAASISAGRPARSR